MIKLKSQRSDLIWGDQPDKFINLNREYKEHGWSFDVIVNMKDKIIADFNTPPVVQIVYETYSGDYNKFKINESMLEWYSRNMYWIPNGSSEIITCGWLVQPLLYGCVSEKHKCDAIIETKIFKKYVRVALDIVKLNHYLHHNEMLESSDSICDEFGLVMSYLSQTIIIKVCVSESLFKVDLNNAVLYLYIPIWSTFDKLLIDPGVIDPTLIVPVGLITCDVSWNGSKTTGIRNFASHNWADPYFRMYYDKIINEINQWCVNGVIQRGAILIDFRFWSVNWYLFDIASNIIQKWLLKNYYKNFKYQARWQYLSWRAPGTTTDQLFEY